MKIESVTPVPKISCPKTVNDLRKISGLLNISKILEKVIVKYLVQDIKVTLEAQLGLIGGTMGLLTGFSILSGVEIVYFLIKLFMSLCGFRY